MSYGIRQETGRPVKIKDEGLTLVSNVKSVDFTGDGVAGSAIGSDVTEEITGGGGGGGGAWGTITGTLSDQTDLQDVLDELQVNIDGKQDAGSYLTSSSISDTAYGIGWDGDTTHAASKNAIYDAIEGLSSVYAPVLGADDNYVTDTEKTVIGNTSGANTGDQSVPVKATGAEINTGTDDAKFVTPKALEDQTTFAKLISPSFTTPALGTPSAGTLTNCSFPTLNQNTTGTAANLSGTPALPNGTTATTQAAADNSTKLATTAYADTAAAGGGATAALDNLASVAINAALVLGTSDAFALGSATKMWSDLFLASGSVVNFNNGDVTITHSLNTLTVAGGTIASTLTGNVTGDCSGSSGSCTGNSDTVTTNANLTGIVTSVGNATAIANKAIAIAKLADGTDGQLITWDAAGVIATVAVGTATQVLTSNGVGAAPTFQDAAGGGASTALDNLAAVQINVSLVSDTDITDSLGTGDVRWKDAWFQTLSAGLTAADTLKLRGRDVDGSTYIDILTITSNNTVTADLNALVTIGGNAILDDTSTASALTSVGTLTALQVDNININLNTISSTAGTDLLITPLANQQIVLDNTIIIDAGVVTGATSITSTAFVGDVTGDVTGNADTVTNATFTTALTVDTGTLTLTAAGANNSVLTIGAGASSISGANTGDQDLSGKADVGQTMHIGTTSVAINRASAALTLAGITLTTPDIGTPTAGTLTNCSFPTLNQSTTGSAATLTNARTIGGVSFNGSANIVPNTITIADESADTTCFVGFFTAATGGLQPKTGTNLTFNSSTGVLTTTGGLNVAGNTVVRGVTKTVCANDANDKIQCDYICDGTADQVQIQAAIDDLPSNGGMVVLSDGTFSVSAGIAWDKHSVILRGQGVDATQITSTAATFDGITVGTRQAGGLMRNWNILERFTYSHAGGASTKACIKIDGGGKGIQIRNVQTNEGAFGFQLIDIDRAYFENLDANNVRDTGISCEVGLENTYGTVTFYNCSAALSDNDTTGWEFTSTAAQGSPNRFDRIGIYGSLFFATSGQTGTTGLKMTVGASAMIVEASLFENNVTQVHITDETQITFLASSFMYPSVSTDIFKFETDNHLVTVQDCRIQQGTNCFNGVSGWTRIALLGQNTDQGNITNMFVGQFGNKGGTDLLFAGSNVLTLGSTVDRFVKGWFTDFECANDITIGGTALASIYSPIAGSASITTVGALDTGSITSGFTSIDVGAGAITTTGDITGGGIHITGDTAAGDNAALGYTAAEGLIMTGQGSTNDLTFKNDADAEVMKVLTGTTTLTMAGAIQLGETSIKLDAVLSADAKWSGITIAGVSGVTTLAIGDLIYLNANDSRWELVDANLSDGYDKQLGIALTAAADGAALEVLVFGKVRSATFPAFTVGSPLYISETAGDLTHTAPTTTDSATRIVGIALTATDFLFNPSQDYLIHV